MQCSVFVKTCFFSALKLNIGFCCLQFAKLEAAFRGTGTAHSLCSQGGMNEMHLLDDNDVA